MLTPIAPVRSGRINSNGLVINFESYGDTNNESILLIMGNSADLNFWRPEFFEPLLAAGYHVVRFDNRDVGGSTWITDWDEEEPYTLEDMALDTVGLMDALQIEAAHLIGASLGGQIAQRLAITHSERVLTLTLLFSTGFIFDDDPAVHPELLTEFGDSLEVLAAQYPGYRTDNEDKVEYNVAMWLALSGSRYPFDEPFYRVTYENMTKTGRYNPMAAHRQRAAAKTSGSRLGELPQITTPTLAIHGTEDPIVHFAHTEKLVDLIPGANLLLVDGLGHEIPAELFDDIGPELFAHFKQAQD